MLPAALLVLLASGDLLGPPIKQDGFSVKPPKSFRMARMDLFHGTRAGTVAVSPQSARYLSAALVDGDGEDAASLLFSVIEASLVAGPALRDELSTATVRHFRDELDQPFALERTEIVNGRVEVLGSVRQGSQLRRVVVAAWPAEGRHVVAVASAPSGRWEALAPHWAACFDSLRVDAPQAGAPRRLAWAVAAGLGAALMVSIGLWRRRQASRQG